MNIIADQTKTYIKLHTVDNLVVKYLGETDSAENLKEHSGRDTKLRPKVWKVETDDLTAQKDRLYSEMRKLKEEVAEAETVKKCVEQVILLTEQRKEKSKAHDASL